MKRIALAAAASLALCLAATPAAATQGLHCRPLSGSGPAVDIVIGSLGIVGVSIAGNGPDRTSMGEGAPLAMRQAWIDEQRIWIDISDSDYMRSEGRLRLARTGPRGAPRFAGTFTRAGRLYRLRCEES